jgi:hypothetical protein
MRCGIAANLTLMDGSAVTLMFSDPKSTETVQTIGGTLCANLEFYLVADSDCVVITNGKLVGADCATRRAALFPTLLHWLKSILIGLRTSFPSVVGVCVLSGTSQWTGTPVLHPPMASPDPDRLPSTKRERPDRVGAGREPLGSGRGRGWPHDNTHTQSVGLLGSKQES